MKTDIYYFSGTGNSLHVARELQKRIPGSRLIPIVSLLHLDKIETNAHALGFIFPAYACLPPVPVIRFLNIVSVESSKYIFSIATRAHSPIWANNSIEKILNKKGRSLSARFILNMAGNCEGAYRYRNIFPTKKIIDELEIELQTRLDEIGEIVGQEEAFNEEDVPPYPFTFWENLFYPLLASFGEKWIVNATINIKFFADADCNGCGICEKICLAQKVRLLHHKPVWQENISCFSCFACYNYCPCKAILVKKSTTDKSRRYHHPEISFDDIAMQKQIPDNLKPNKSLELSP